MPTYPPVTRPLPAEPQLPTNVVTKPPGSLTIAVADLPALAIAEWAALGLGASADGSAATLDQTAYRANLKTHLNALGYVSGSSPAPASGQPTPLTQTRVALQRNVLVTGSDFAGADGTSPWALTTNLSVAAGVDGYVQWVVSIPAGTNAPGALVILNPGTALPSGSSEYLNTHGLKRDYAANGPLVIKEGAGTNYPAVQIASGDLLRQATVGAQVVDSISKDGGVTFTTIVANPRHVDANGVITPLTLMLAGEAANVIHSVSYYNFS